MSLAEHLPALQVVVPLMAAPVAILLRHPRVTWAWTLLVCLASLGIAASLLQQVVSTGEGISYAMGGWAAPIGIVYEVDVLSAWVQFIVTLIASVVMVYAPRSLDAELRKSKHYLFYAAYLLCMTGMLGMTITGDAFNVFVFLEISSLSSYVLIALGRSRRALIAAFRYLIMGSLGGTFILIGIGLMYMMTGTLNMADLAERLPAVSGTRTILVSFAFVTVGASLKLALWPLHSWLPNAYAYAPSVVSAFIAATSTKVMVYVLIRFVFGIYGVSFAFDHLGIGLPLMALALSGIWVASGVAIFQTNVKRLLAYSSVAQIGYMILGVSLGTPAGIAAAVLHLFNHALMKGGMFLAMGNVFRQVGSVELEDLRGIGKVMPYTTAAFVLGGMGLIGVPLTVGFTSKWVLISAILERGLWPVAVAALLSSLLALTYVGRVVEAAWFQEPGPALDEVTEAPLWMLVPTWGMALATVALGVYGAWATDISFRAANMLLGVP